MKALSRWIRAPGHSTPPEGREASLLALAELPELETWRCVSSRRTARGEVRAVATTSCGRVLVLQDQASAVHHFAHWELADTSALAALAPTGTRRQAQCG